jgi:hypothetical protein
MLIYNELLIATVIKRLWRFRGEMREMRVLRFERKSVKKFMNTLA